MKRYLLLLSVFLAITAINVTAQKCTNPYLEFRDFSFEHTPANGNAGPEWPSCKGSGDIQPIMVAGTEIGVRVPAKAGNGKSYVGMLCNIDRLAGDKEYRWQEAIYQQLNKPMVKGITYKLAIDVMVPHDRWEYDQWGPPKNQAAKQHIISGTTNALARRRSFPGALAIRAAMAAGVAGEICATAKVLWRSPTVANDDQWVTFEFTITPDANYTHIVITPEIPDEVNNTKDATGSAEIVDYVCIDNLRSFKPDSIKTTVKHISCPGGSDGAGTVILSDKANLPTKSITWSNGVTNVKDIKDLKAGTYYVTVIDNFGYIYCDSIIVKEPKPYKLEVTATDAKCFDSKDGSATAIVTDARAPITYSWDPSGQTTATATGIGAGKYTCTVKDSAGCEKKIEVEVKQPTKIEATSSHTDVTVPNGDDGTATVTSVKGGTPNYTYKWNDPAGQTTEKATNLKAGTYTCVITDANGCTTQVVEKIKQPDAFDVKVDTIHNLCFGDKKGYIAFHASKGTPAYIFTWEPNVSSDSIAKDLPAGEYKCTIKDAKGAMVIMKITIRQPDELKADISSKNINCFGANNGEAAVSNVTGGTKDYKYLWTPGGAATTGINNLGPGTYSCLITDKNGCTLTKTTTITEPPKLVAETVTKNISCFGYKDGNVAIAASGGVKPYGYVLNSGTVFQADSSFKGLSAGTYSYTVKDANDCTVPGTFILTEPPTPVKTTTVTPTTCKNGSDGTAVIEVTGSTGTVEYLWQPGGYTTASVNGLKAGTYVCKITYNSGACSTDTSVVITEPDSVKIHIDPQTICYGKSATLTAVASGGNGGPYTISWNNGASTDNPYIVSPLASTVYTAVATDVKGCKSAVFTVKVTVKDPLKVIAASPASICIGKSVRLNATANGGDGNYSYEWLPTGAGNTASIIVTPTITTLYTVNLTDGCGTPPVSDTVRVTVIQKPTVDFTADIREGCPTLCVKYTGTSKITGDVIKDWKWHFGDGDSAAIQNPGHCYTKPGFYTVKLHVKADKSGCENDTTKISYINVFEVPQADFVFTPTIATLEAPKVNFFNKSIKAVTWAWDFGDTYDPKSNTSTLENPSHAYSDTGVYCIKLKVESEKKCPSSIEKCLRVIPEVSIYVPNAFTPNGDGKNDGFFAKGRYIKDFKMWIFDRWGMLIFTSDNINDQWNGRVYNTGESVQQDTYVYKIRAIDWENKKHDLVGRVSIIR